MQQSVGKRIIVIGSSNAGKTTVAARLSQRLGVPYTDLDTLHWEPGWAEAELDAFRNRVRIATEPACWVLAGNYMVQQHDISWPRADTIVWLDLGLPTVLRRCVRRAWRRWRTQEVLSGARKREIFWDHLMLWNSNKSLIAHILRTHHRRRREFAAMSRDPRWAHLTFIRLRSVEESDRWINSMTGVPTAI